MDTFLPWAAFGAAALSLLLAARPWSATAAPPATGPTPFWEGWTASRPQYLACLLLAAVMTASGAIWSKDLPLMLEAGYGAALGVAVVLATHAAGLALASKARHMLVPVGFAAAGGGAVLLFESGQAAVFMGMCVGATLSASLVGGQWARTAAMLAVGMCAVGMLGLYRDDLPRGAGVGVLLLVLAVPSLGIANAWGEFASRQSGRGDSTFWPTVIAAALLCGAAKLAAAKYLFLNDLFLTGAGAVVSAWFVSWVLREGDDNDSGSFAIASLIWLGWMTVAFGLMKGYGVAVSAVCGGTLLAFTGGTKALVSLGIVTAYSLYRVFLEEYPKESRAIDVGQHYAVMGIVAGIALPLAIGRWVAPHRKLMLTVFAGVVAIALVLGMTFVVGARGAVGFLVGLSICPIVLGISSQLRFGIVTLALGLGSVLVLGFRYIVALLGIERESKVQLLGYALAIVIVLIFLAQWLGSANKEVKTSELTA